jgi:Glycosyl transferase family 11
MKPWTPVPLGRKAKTDGVTLYPIERLGNQLFSYAAVFAQSCRMGVPCYVNKAFFKHVRPERSYNYYYELDVFDNGLVVPDDEAYHLPVYLGFPTIPVARIWHNRVPSFLPGADGKIFMERSFSYDSRFRDVLPGTTMLGMFQSWRYFSDCGDEIRARMRRLTKPSEWYLEMRERIQPGTGAIGLHVRRGDYTLPEQQKIQGLATRPYYERSLSHLRRMGFDGPVYLATDSPEAVREEFAGMGEFLPIDPPPGAHPLEVVLLLSRMDGLVVANSSFSWWAGFIGERPNRVVIAPRPWFTQAGDTSDLLPPYWLTLDRNGYTEEGSLSLDAHLSRTLA